MTTKTLSDNQTMMGTTSEFGTPIPTYDDGFGPLWLYKSANGSCGIVRTQSWETAFELVEDEILSPIPNDIESISEAYGIWIQPTFHNNNYSIPCAPYKVHWNSYLYEENTESYQTRNDAQTRIELFLRSGEAELAEGYTYQSNSTGSGIVFHDLNGESLELASVELLEQDGIILILETDD